MMVDRPCTASAGALQFVRICKYVQLISAYTSLYD